MSGDNETNLKFTDFKLIMDNYQNMIQLNTILLEQQKQLMELQNQIVSRQDNISAKQNKLCDKTNIVIDKLDTCIENLLSTNNIIQTSYKNIDTSMTTKLNQNKDKIEMFHLDTTKQHGKITNKVYISMIGMGTIVIGLVGLLMTVYNKYDIINKTQKMIEQLIVYFNIG